MTCPACHTPALPGDSFCRHCGGGLGGLSDDPARAEDAAVASDLQRACRLMDEGEPERAIELLEAVPSSSAYRAAAESLLAAAHELAGRPGEAARHLQAALRLNPDDQSVQERLLWLRAAKRAPRVTPLAAGLLCAGASFVLAFVVGWLLLHNGREQQPLAMHAAPGGAGLTAAGEAGAGARGAAGAVPPARTAAPETAGVASSPPGADARFQREFTLPPPPRSDAVPGGPPIRIGLPPVRDSAASRQGMGAAAIADVVPLPPEPGTAPAMAGNPGGPAPGARIEEGAETGELDTPESGLIRIRPLGGPAPPDPRAQEGPATDPKIRIEVIGGQAGRG